MQKVLGGFRRLTVGKGLSQPEQKRRLTRMECHIPVTAQYQEELFEAVVTDLGLHGMRLELPRRLPTKAILALDTAGRKNAKLARVVTQVRWCRKKAQSQFNECGVEYVDTEKNLGLTWVEEVLKEMGFKEESVFERRGEVRAWGKLPATLLTTGGGRYRGRVANLGVGGALLEVQKAMAQGTPVGLELGPSDELGKLVLSGKVRHASRAEKQGYWLNGIAFRELTPESSEQLGLYLIKMFQSPEK